MWQQKTNMALLCLETLSRVCHPSTGGSASIEVLFYEFCNWLPLVFFFFNLRCKKKKPRSFLLVFKFQHKGFLVHSWHSNLKTGKVTMLSWRENKKKFLINTWQSCIKIWIISLLLPWSQSNCEQGRSVEIWVSYECDHHNDSSCCFFDRIWYGHSCKPFQRLTCNE